MPKKRSLGKKIRTRRSGATRQKSKRKPESRQPHGRALAVLRRMRRTGQSLTAAAREEHVDPRTVRKHFGAQLRQSAPGKPYRATKADRLSRRMLSPTAQGMAPVIVRGSRQASLLGRYLSAVGEFLRTGRTEALNEFKGKRVGGQLLITDPEVLRTLAQAGALQLEDIYAAPEVSL